MDTGNHLVSPSSHEGNFTDPTISLINQMLMEEDDLENTPSMFHESLALQTTEKSFYDALGYKYPSSSNQILHNPTSDFFSNCSNESRNTLTSANNFFDQSNWVLDQDKHERDFYTKDLLEPISPLNGYFGDGSLDSFQNISKGVAEAEKNRRENNSPYGSREKRTLYREEGDYENDGRSNKQLAGSFTQESDENLEMYDKVLLLPELNPHLHQDCSSPCLQDCSSPCLYDNNDRNQNKTGRKLEQNGSEKGASGGGGGCRGRKTGDKKEMVDFRDLLFQCAADISSANTKSAIELLNQIRQHSSPYGDGTQRLAHHFANALEVRLAGGTGTALSAALISSRRRSAAHILRSFKIYVKACPFGKMYHMYANRSIGKVAQKPRLHIIDFGISYGFQWPGLIQDLSLRPNGPPKVRITGIDIPVPGFHPAESVEAAGRRLATYCKRFGVPFEFNALAKQWDKIDIEDLNIERDEVLVVNCLHRLRHVPDDIVGVTSPRDAVLNLIKRINPELFVHGVQEGKYDTPFFVTRFREVFLNYSAIFDIMDATLDREDEDRILYEDEVLGREIMNVVACEGSNRKERPETHKQWQYRNRRAGFSQLPLNEEVLTNIKDMVESNYNKNFGVDADGKWMVQLWKGRVMFALSCWKPNKE